MRQENQSISNTSNVFKKVFYEYFLVNLFNSLCRWRNSFSSIREILFARNTVLGNQPIRKSLVQIFREFFSRQKNLTWEYKHTNFATFIRQRQ